MSWRSATRTTFSELTAAYRPPEVIMDSVISSDRHAGVHSARCRQRVVESRSTVWSDLPTDALRRRPTQSQLDRLAGLAHGTLRGCHDQYHPA
jgi:hypothetical protein